MITWGEFKKTVEATEGVTDETKIVTFLSDELSIVVDNGEMEILG